jgi:hypothetical protein
MGGMQNNTVEKGKKKDWLLWTEKKKDRFLVGCKTIRISQ